MRFAIMRDRGERTITVQTSQYPIARADELAWGLLGFRLGEARGALVVHAVRPGSSAARVGMQSGDLVVGLAGVPVANVTAFRKKMIEVRLAQSVLLSVQRGNYVYNIQMPLGGRAS